MYVLVFLKYGRQFIFLFFGCYSELNIINVLNGVGLLPTEETWKGADGILNPI